MPDQSQINLVYDVNVLGGQKAYTTFSDINKILIDIKANKVSLNDMFNINFDVSKLDGINKGFSTLVTTNKELLTGIRTLTTEMGKFGQVGQQSANAVAANIQKTKGVSMEVVTGFNSVQRAMGGTADSATDYIGIINSLVQKHTALVNEIGSVQSQISRYEREVKATQSTMEQYGVALRNNTQLESQFTTIISENTEKIALLKVELAQLRTAASEVGGAIGTMNKAQNPALLLSEAEAVAANKVALAENNMELKQNAKLAAAAAGSMDMLSLSLGIMRDRYRALSEAERESLAGQEMLGNIQRMDAQIKKLDATIGNNQRKVGDYGTVFDKMGNKLMQFVVRDLFRAAAGFIVFTAVFEGAQKIWENATAKEFQFSEATNQLAESLKNLNDVIDKLNLSEQTLLENELKLQSISKGYEYTTLEDHKQKLELLKAIGVQNGETYLFEKSRLEATIELGKAEITQLEKKKKGVTELAAVLEQARKAAFGADGTLWSDVKGTFGKHQPNAPNEIDAANDVIEKSLLPREVKTKIQSELQKAVDGGAAAYDALEAAAKKYGVDAIDIQKQINQKQNEFLNQQAAMDAEVKRLAYSKNIELFNQLVQLKDQFRQLSEKQDIASVDKIVADTKAKYTLMMEDFKRKTAEFAKSFPDHKLPDELQSKVDQILAVMRLQERAEQKNQTEEYLKSSSMIALQHRGGESQAGADLAKDYSDNGIPDYDKMVEALDKETAAKKETIMLQYENEKNAYIQNGDSIETLQDQMQERIKRADAEGYRSRLALANDFYKRLSQSTIDGTNLILTDLDTYSAQTISAILTGKDSEATKQYKIERAKLYDIINKARAIIDENRKLLPDANKAVEKTKSDLDNAKTPEEKQAAGIQHGAASQTQADIINKIANSQKDIDEAKDKLEEGNRKMVEAVKNQAIESFHQIGTAYVQMLQQQEEARARHAERNLDWNKKQLDSQVQSNAQQIANDKAYMLEKEQLEKQKFNQQKKLAEAQMLVDFTTAVMSTISANAKLGPLAPEMDAIMIAFLAATYGAKLSELNAAQYGEGGDVPSNGGTFGGNSHAAGGTPFVFKNRSFEAEADELAIINKRSASSNRVMTVTGTPKQIASGINAHGGGVNFAPGATIHKFEYGGSWGGSVIDQLQPPRFVTEYYQRKTAASLGYNEELSGMRSDMGKMFGFMEHQANNNMAMHASTSGRIDNIKVSLDHRDVTTAQNQHSKIVKVGKL